jgi:hypothetical protein
MDMAAGATRRAEITRDGGYGRDPAGLLLQAHGARSPEVDPRTPVSLHPIANFRRLRPWEPDNSGQIFDILAQIGRIVLPGEPVKAPGS